MLRSKGPVCRPERGQHPLAANNSAYMHSLHRSRQLTLGRHQAQHAVTLVLRAKRRPGDDDVVDSLLRFADKYVGQGVSSSKGTGTCGLAQRLLLPTPVQGTNRCCSTRAKMPQPLQPHPPRCPSAASTCCCCPLLPCGC